MQNYKTKYIYVNPFQEYPYLGSIQESQRIF